MDPSYMIALAVVTIVSAARLTRLALIDDFPPILWLRNKYIRKTEGSKWQEIAYCEFCMALWMASVLVVWADLAGMFDGATAWGTSGELAEPIWWLFNGAMSAGYLAAMLVLRDGDDGQAK